jgi:hypothetical protein
MKKPGGDRSIATGLNYTLRLARAEETAYY